MSGTQNKICFVIAPLDVVGSEVRKRSDQILRHIIEPAAKDAGYTETIRADKIDQTGFITTQIIQHLIDDAIVVADLTGDNPNVFYELAIRHSFRKPVVQLIQEGQKIPFDVAPLRTVTLDHRDLDSASAARATLTMFMKATLQKPDDVESPVSVAVDREALRSGNPQQRELAQVLDSVTKITNMMSNLERSVRALESQRAWDKPISGSLGALQSLVSGSTGKLASIGDLMLDSSNAAASTNVGRFSDSFLENSGLIPKGKNIKSGGDDK